MMAQWNKFSWCSTASTTLTCCVKWRSLRTSDRDNHCKTSYCHLTLGSTDTHNGPTLAKFSVKLLQFSLAETAQYVRQHSWCCMEGISLLITPVTIRSPIYPNLWMCHVRDSGLFIFLTQILIWSYSVAVLSQLYWAWIQDKEFRVCTHTHTFCPISWLFSIPPVPYSLLDYSVQVLVLHITCQTLFGSKLAASLSAATYSSSFSFAMVWSASVTKDCKQSQSSFLLREVPVSRTFLHISFRISSKGAPPPGSPNRAPIETGAPFPEPSFHYISKFPVNGPPPPPGSPTWPLLWREMPISRSFFYM